LVICVVGNTYSSCGQAAELSYTTSKREGRPTLSQTELTLRQQLSKNNDARIIVSHYNNRAVNNADSVTATAVAWYYY
jgi:hypothetical protein